MKKNNKGFTLIELLAIIVILAIIAVITVPIILNIIDNARKGAAKNSVIGYAKAVELAHTEYQYADAMGEDYATDYKNDYKVEVTLDGSEENKLELYINYEGDKVECNSADITNGKLTLDSCTVDDNEKYTFDYTSGKACELNDNECTGKE